MLQAIRDRVTGIVAIFVLGLLAVPFVFFGLDSYIRDVPQDAVASVGDTEITLTEFQTEFARYRAQLRARQGENYDDLAANSPESRRQFLESMIDRRLLTQHARNLGLAISPNTVAEVIRGVEAFQVDGQFDPEVYRQRITASGQTPAGFERDLVRDLLAQELPAAITSSTVVTRADVDRWLRVQLEQRDIAMLKLSSEPFRDPDAIDASDIESFYEQNQDQFMRPERVTVEYIELDTSEMAEDIEIEEAELRERYEATRNRFMTPERRRASHILVTFGDERTEQEARSRIEELEQQLAQGAEFAELAREHSEDPASAGQGGDLGWIEPGVMMPEFEDALFALEQGEISEPVKTEFGWHLIKLNEIEAPRGQSFEEAREQIAAEIAEERADELYIELTERLVDLVYADPTGLDAVAEDLGLELKTAGPFSRFSAEGVLAEPKVLEAIFSDLVLIEREASEPIEIGRNHAVVVRVTDHQPSEPRPLEDVEAEIRSRLVREAAREAARKRAEELLARVREEPDTDLAALAESDDDLELIEREVTRRSFELGSQLLEQIFEMNVPPDDQPAYRIASDGEGWAIVRLDAVRPGQPDQADDAQRRSARQQIAFSRSSREFQGLLEWLRENTEISVVEDRL